MNALAHKAGIICYDFPININIIDLFSYLWLNAHVL